MCIDRSSRACLTRQAGRQAGPPPTSTRHDTGLPPDTRTHRRHNCKSWVPDLRSRCAGYSPAHLTRKMASTSGFTSGTRWTPRAGDFTCNTRGVTAAGAVPCLGWTAAVASYLKSWLACDLVMASPITRFISTSPSSYMRLTTSSKPAPGSPDSPKLSAVAAARGSASNPRELQ